MTPEAGGPPSESGWRQTAPTWATLGVLVIVGAGMFLLRRGGDAGPEAVVYAAFDAAARADARAYLACFGGEMAERLAAARGESGALRFDADLRERGAALTGLAVSRAGDGAAASDEVVLRVEQVYRDRNEAQEFLVRRAAGRWRIYRIGPSATVRMPIPYGTPVYTPEPGNTNRTETAR